MRKVQVRKQRTEPLMMGSAKSNIGHLEGGAAMGGIVKCIMQCGGSLKSLLKTEMLRSTSQVLPHPALEDLEPAPGARDVRGALRDGACGLCQKLKTGRRPPSFP